MARNGKEQPAESDNEGSQIERNREVSSVINEKKKKNPFLGMPLEYFRMSG